jgi:hypothetical protein
VFGSSGSSFYVVSHKYRKIEERGKSVRTVLHIPLIIRVAVSWDRCLRLGIISLERLNETGWIPANILKRTAIRFFKDKSTFIYITAGLKEAFTNIQTGSTSAVF